jgi:phosphomannomutase/phosphoglucomutase
MTALAETVVRQGLELGVGFDGDADRIGVVDEKGQLIYGDMIMAIFARDILKTEKSGTFIAEVKCSKNLYDDIEAHGGRAIMWRTGHSLIKRKMKEEKALLGGEMSGHMFFAHRFLGFDDAIYSACRLLEIVARTTTPVSAYLADLPKMVNTPEIRVPCPDDQKFKLVELVKQELGKEHDIITVDGVRVRFPDGWGLLRASNTGPLLVLRFEAESEKRLGEIRSLVEGALERLRSQL